MNVNGRFFALWNWILPLLLGLTAGWFGMICLEVWLEGSNGRNRSFTPAPFLAAPAQGTGTNNMAAFLRVNPFKLTPMPTSAASDTSTTAAAPPPVEGSLASAILRGTSPGFIAWLEDQGKVRLVMLGDSFDVYTLEEVTYLEAIFVRGDERVVKGINFRRENRPTASTPTPQPSAGRQARVGGQQITAPSGNRPGVIGRERVNYLLENPFDELRNIRLRPPENGQGLLIEWINNNSIFSQLGVREGDVIQGINGIAFRNAMDLNNAMSSLMGSDQFAVEVMRNGSATVLHYEVR